MTVLSRLRTLGLVAVSGALVVAAAAIVTKQPPLADTDRHVQSRVVSLARYGPEEDSIWVYIASERDIRISPDGSGAIAERFLERTYPTSAEEAQWQASAQEPYGGINETFGPGELFYFRSEEVRAAVTDPLMRFAPAGDALRRIGSHLAETAQEPAVLEAALSTATGLTGARVTSEADRVEIAGVSADGQLEIILVFETSPVRLLEETWNTRVDIPGLDREPPFMIFQRTILSSETLG